MNVLNIRLSLGSHLDYIYPMDWSGQTPNLVRQRIQWPSEKIFSHSIILCRINAYAFIILDIVAHCAMRWIKYLLVSGFNAFRKYA